MNKNFFVFILLAIYHLLKTDFSICGPYLFESHRSQMYDQLTAYFSNRVIRMLAMEYVSLIIIILKKKKNTNKLNNVYVVYVTGHNCLTVYFFTSFKILVSSSDSLGAIFFFSLFVVLLRFFFFFFYRDSFSAVQFHWSDVFG